LFILQGRDYLLQADNRGRIISSLDYYSTDEQVMYADVPVQYSFTIYAQVGDLFAWLCIAFLIIITTIANF
jgi:apolipoprotein N-acyltransferase